MRLFGPARIKLCRRMDLALCTGQRPADVLKIVVGAIADGKLSIAQNKTGKKLRISIEGDLADVVKRIMDKPRNAINPALLQDPGGQRLTYFALRSRFDKARETAGVSFQFKDLRAKSTTDTEDLAHAQSLLGHKNRSTTKIYTTERRGDLVAPPFKKSSKINRKLTVKKIGRDGRQGNRTKKRQRHRLRVRRVQDVQRTLARQGAVTQNVKGCTMRPATQSGPSHFCEADIQMLN